MLSQSDQIEAATIITSNTAISGHSEPSSNNNNNINDHETQGSNTSHGTSKSETIQQSLHNNQIHPERELDRRRRQPQLQERPLSQTDSTPPATGDRISESKIDHEKLWIYFRRSKVNAARLKCLLCSAELYKPIGDNLVQNNSMRSLLWNHLRVKHAIDGSVNESSGERRKRRQVAFSNQEKQQQHNNNNNNRDNTLKPSASNSNHHHLHNNHRLKTSATSATLNSARIPSLNNNSNSKNMTKADQRHPKLMGSSATSKKLPIDNNDIYDLRRDLDLLDYSDLSKASLKPLPNSSLSRNLFERLNQLSSPVTRKLKFWNKKSFQVNQYDPCFKVIYLGNLGVQFWSKDETCLDKPLNTLWNNYLVNMKTEIVMRLTICNSGLKAITRQHGLTQYWSNRLVYCCSHKSYPKVFAWIYRHEGKKMRQELRCHAVFCSSPERASKMVSLLNQRLVCALEEFKREKKSRGQTPSIAAKCNLSSGATDATTGAMTQTTLPRTVPLRRQILAKGAANFRPPLERSKSAPKLTSIREEDYESEEDELNEDEFGGGGGDDDDGDDDGNDEGEGDDDDHLNEEGKSDNDDCEHDADDISRDELEYEHSFDDGDDDSNSDYFNDDDDDELGKHDDGQISGSTYKAESNEETSNSSVYAAGDISYDNIVANRQHLSTNQERLDNESTLTAPITTKSSSSLKERSSFRSASLNQNESLHSDRTESMSDGGQHELDSQLASTTSSTLNSCHINNTNTPIASDHENDADAETTATTDRSKPQNHNTVAHHFGQIKL